jgi:hypothetical protein
MYLPDDELMKLNPVVNVSDNTVLRQPASTKTVALRGLSLQFKGVSN